MKASKTLGCEPFYQLAAASIASWFRRRSIRDVINELSLDQKMQYEPLQLRIDEIIDAKKRY